MVLIKDIIMKLDVTEEITYNQAGLVPAIAQQHDSGEVLMLAWMNKESIMETLKTKQVCYWSRSRKNYGVKEKVRVIFSDL